MNNDHDHNHDNDNDNDNDDRPVGRILSRRRALALFGMTGIAFTATGAVVATADGSKAAAAAAAEDNAVDCVAKPEMTEGPYFVDEGLNRRDIRVDTSDGSVAVGTPLALTLKVTQIVDCKRKPLPDAMVDIWQCNAGGIYSDVVAEGTAGHHFLRGYQITNGGGIAHFTTILPGWYRGRTVHIHVKIRTTGPDGNAYEFTSQLYFTQDFTTAYLAQAPYAGNGTPDTINANDMHYADGGDQLLLNPNQTDMGYEATFAIALDLSDTAVGADDSFSMGDGGAPGPMPSGSPGPLPTGLPPSPPA